MIAANPTRIPTSCSLVIDWWKRNISTTVSNMSLAPPEPASARVIGRHSRDRIKVRWSADISTPDRIMASTSNGEDFIVTFSFFRMMKPASSSAVNTDAVKNPTNRNCINSDEESDTVRYF